MTPLKTAVSTTNPCKLCTPLGAALAFHGIEGTLCLLHGSQGCSTYIRRYLISHFKEPIDVASTNFSETSAIFGGRDNFLKAVRNLKKQYNPTLIGAATTCLAETMGEDVSLYLHELSKADDAAQLPAVVMVSTASYRGTHMEGFHSTVKALVDQLGFPKAKAPIEGPAAASPAAGHIRLGEPVQGPDDLLVFPGMVSPSDLRWLKKTLADFGLAGHLVPDYSETLDGGLWDDYQPLPQGGTPVAALKNASQVRSWVELGRIQAKEEETAGTLLGKKGDIAGFRLGWPVGVRETDRYLQTLAEISGQPIPDEYKKSRMRLIDSFADGHKIVSGVRAAVYGEEDLVTAVCTFLGEIGVHVVLAASGGKSGKMEETLRELLPVTAVEDLTVMDDADFTEMEEILVQKKVDVLIGHSKGFKTATALKLPLLRLGFPIHDRFGGSRIKLLGYEGAQELFDKLANLILEKKQNDNPVGYTYYG